MLIHSWRTCGFLIKTSRIGRWRGRRSTKPPRQTRTKFARWRSFRAAAAEGWLEESMSAVSRKTTRHDAIYRGLPIEDDEIRACKESRNG
jgi:hypothetical protein